MIALSRTNALQRLAELRENFRERITREYELRAKDCGTCETKGACCLDAHFVNVRVSRLDAEAMRSVIDKLPADRKDLLLRDVERTIERFDLLGGDDRTYACPLFDHSAGCLVHADAKPLACIAHACYERIEDLPPDQLLADQEVLVERLNMQTYGFAQSWHSIPVAITRILRS